MPVFAKTMRKNCKVVLGCLRKTLYIIGIVLIAEFIISISLSMVLNDSTYLSLYLSEKAIDQTEIFLKHEHDILLPSKQIGWRNRPNCVIRKWRTDSIGARTTTPISHNKSKPNRVLLLGSSTINGGVSVDNNETISGYLEDDNIETINFGTMMYDLDQVLLFVKSELHKFKPDVAVIGVDYDKGYGLLNHYVAFRLRKEVNMPFIKPRFVLNEQGLKIVPIEPYAMLNKIKHNAQTLNFLEKQDHYYINFKKYQWLGLLPLTRLIQISDYNATRLMELYRTNRELSALQNRIIKEIIQEANNEHTSVILVKYIDERLYKREGIFRFLPDIYQEGFDQLKSHNAKLVNTRLLLQKSGLSAKEIFNEDGVHFKPAANKIIAESIRPLIHKTIATKN